MTWVIRIGDGDKPEGHEESWVSRRVAAIASNPKATLHELGEALIHEALEFGLPFSVIQEKPRARRKRS